jgi:hypothetical protein
MRAVKAVKQNYRPMPQILSLLVTFPRMVNDCIRIGLETGTTSRLCRASYPLLKSYDLHTWYSLYAVSVAASILKNHRRTLRKKGHTKRPRARKLMAEIGSPEPRFLTFWHQRASEGGAGNSLLDWP